MVGTPPRPPRQHQIGSDMTSPTTLRIHRHRRLDVGDRYPFNPVIVLRGPADVGGGGGDSDPPASFELYYDDGAGSGFGVRAVS
ncbi:hypothetical protein KSP40_PGU012542 [Platanthera guangdongensis]|uniref:Uncharacterized protein n=1 Tax=Platanthera guangdongensis TaxID=2320717 RepID=A0ABR2LX88_9ASPA